MNTIQNSIISKVLEHIYIDEFIEKNYKKLIKDCTLGE